MNLLFHSNLITTNLTHSIPKVVILVGRLLAKELGLRSAPVYLCPLGQINSPLCGSREMSACIKAQTSFSVNLLPTVGFLEPPIILFLLNMFLLSGFEMCPLLKARTRRFRVEKGVRAGQVKGSTGWPNTTEAGQPECGVPLSDSGKVLARCAVGTLTV